MLKHPSEASLLAGKGTSYKVQGTSYKVQGTSYKVQGTMKWSITGFLLIAVGHYAREISYCYLKVVIFLYEFRKKILDFLTCYKMYSEILILSDEV